MGLYEIGISYNTRKKTEEKMLDVAIIDTYSSLFECAASIRLDCVVLYLYTIKLVETPVRMGKGITKTKKQYPSIKDMRYYFYDSIGLLNC